MNLYQFIPPRFIDLFHFQSVIDVIDKYLEPHQVILLNRTCSQIKTKIQENARILNIFQQILINDEYCEFLPRKKLIEWYIKQFKCLEQLRPKQLAIKSLDPEQRENDQILLEELISSMASHCTDLKQLKLEKTPFELV
ncbi:UNKNOWN [Stylonychia lemnae]|uniref:F-box domain-containing protein n=1 Tax=Stylonychia lemnae TaxID=5949 RepID=A0A077ZUX4_STYLE|nr:UNKNOWN [Stylonychia lemnae]|eukprot:CDW73700.1 UNKNOWN [Stylonychia lemnae]